MRTARGKNSKTKIPTTDTSLLIRVQLDYRTVITLTRMESFAAWREKFPEAKIISPASLVGSEGFFD